MNAFWLLCVTLSLAVFFIGCAAGTLLANAAACAICHVGGKPPVLRLPGLLFSIRVFPIAFGAALTVGFAVPSFLLLEPERSVEAPEPYLIVLAALAVAVILFLAARCARLLSRSRKIRNQWLREAELLPVSVSVPVYQVQAPESLIAVVGILHPKIFVGKAASANLTREELEAAVAHELAHIRSFDNLKQLVLKTTRLPAFFASLGKMDLAWSGAAELVADASALRRGTSALELSSAILKVARMKTVPNEVIAVAACHLVPPDTSSSALAMRVQHLHDVLEMQARPRTQDARYCLPAILLTSAVAYLLVLPTALPVVHRWMEWLAK